MVKSGETVFGKTSGQDNSINNAQRKIRSGWDCADSTYSSTSEAEPDSEPEEEDDDSNDPEKFLSSLIVELENLKLDLDNVACGSRAHPSDRAAKLALATPRIDSYRLSRANLEDSQDVELDAILGELCALESQFDKEMQKPGHARSASAHASTTEALYGSVPPSGQQRFSTSSSFAQLTPGQQQQPAGHRLSGHSRSSSGGTRPKFDISGLHMEIDGEEVSVKRTESPDNDSAFSDNVSMLSSESSASSGGGPAVPGREHFSSQAPKVHNNAVSPTQLFIKAFSADNSAKSLLADERMSVGIVCRLLADKNHVSMDPKWAVVELIPELYMERIYEDHESLVENLLLWTRDSCNKLLFLERFEKYDLFSNPEDYLLGMSSSESGTDLDDEGKHTLLEEFFTASGVGVPEVEGLLYLKSDGKKAWKKYFFVLRASGLYYSPKGKSKFSKDLICLTTFEMNNVYGGLGWKKKYKAPTDYGFAIKHPQIQTKSSKYIKYLCAEDERSLKQWVTGIRIAKYGCQLKENYDALMRDIEEEDLDSLAQARSFSMSSMAKTLQVSPDGSDGSPDNGRENQLRNQSNKLPMSPLSSPVDKDADAQSNRSSDSTPTPTIERNWRKGSLMGRQDSIRSSASSSSGCMSERSGSGTPTVEQIAFEADFPVGTIKRKPSMTPKIPLTSTTRNLAKQSVGEECLNSRTSPESNPRSPSELNPAINAGIDSLSRNANRFMLRRSQTDDRIHVNGPLKNSPIRQIEFRHQILPQPPAQFDSCNSSPTKTLSPPTSPLPPDDASLSEDEFPPPPSELEDLPPPDAFRGSTLSLDSLPPPPPPLNLSDECSWPSTSSLNSLPPPPSPLVQSPIHQNYDSRASTPEAVIPTKISPTVPPKPSFANRRMSETDMPPYLAELKHGISPSHSGRNWRKMSCDPATLNSYGTDPRSHRPSPSSGSSSNSSSSSTLSPVDPLSPKRILDQWNNANPSSGIYETAQYLASGSVSASIPPAVPLHQGGHYQQGQMYQQAQIYQARSPLQQQEQNIYGKIEDQSKPSPPRRDNKTRLSNGSLPRRSSELPQPGPIPSPPETFLKDLQRVIKKKWKVAQQLSIDLSSTPHEILGFRDPCYLPPPNSEGKRQVFLPNEPARPFHVVSPEQSMEHYGVLQDHSPQDNSSPRDTYYDEVSADISSRIAGQVSGPSGRRLSHVSPEEMGRTFVISRKKNPPPPPKRSETTQLSRR